MSWMIVFKQTLQFTSILFAQNFSGNVKPPERLFVNKHSTQFVESCAWSVLQTSVKSLYKKATYRIVKLQPKCATTACGNTSIRLFFFCLLFRGRRWRYLRANGVIGGILIERTHCVPLIRWWRLLGLERGFEDFFFSFFLRKIRFKHAER